MDFCLPIALQSGRTEAGCDEAGRGALAGPVVAAAVVLPVGFSDPLLRDSKMLHPDERQRIAHRIQKEALSWGIGMSSIDVIEEKNILWASVAAMHRALDGLSPIFSHIAVDGKHFIRYAHYTHSCVVKGDAQYGHIAAASILAKVCRDTHMEQLSTQYPMYGWAQNKGYPTRAHKAALKTYGRSPAHRPSFANISQMDLLV